MKKVTAYYICILKVFLNAYHMPKTYIGRLYTLKK